MDLLLKGIEIGDVIFHPVPFVLEMIFILVADEQYEQRQEDEANDTGKE